MTTLDSTASLAVAELVFFSLALLVSAAVVFRHGFSRQAGWVFLVILCILRIIGSSATLYIHTHAYPPSTSVLELATITSSIGTAPLLMALLGVLGRIHNALRAAAKNLNDMVFHGFHLVAIVALILAIVGGVFRAKHDPSKQTTGESLIKASSIIFVAVFVAAAAITVLTFMRKQYVRATDQKLVLASILVLPLLLVRVIYLVIVSFSTDPDSEFYYANVNVYVSAFMQFLMEALVVIVFSTAGLLVPKQSKDANLAGP